MNPSAMFVPQVPCQDFAWERPTELPEADRRPVVEVHCEERERREMARDRGISTTGLNVRLCRALKRLRGQVLLQKSAVPHNRQPCRPRLDAVCRASG